MASYIEVDGDATKPVRSSPEEIVIIPHCCNNEGKWGAGFVLSLNKTFGLGPFHAYKEMERESPNGLLNRLGEICDYQVDENLYVINMIAQEGVRSVINPKPIKYWALLKCMQEVVTFIGSIKNSLYLMDIEDREIVIHTCRFGSDLSGGNWDFIKELIMETWVDRGIDVVIYNYKK